MVDASQYSIESGSPGSFDMDSDWEGTMRLDEELSNPDFESRAICPICQRVDVLMEIGGAIFCAACGYASDSAGGCT